MSPGQHGINRGRVGKRCSDFDDTAVYKYDSRRRVSAFRQRVVRVGERSQLRRGKLGREIALRLCVHLVPSPHHAVSVCPTRSCVSTVQP